MEKKIQLNSKETETIEGLLAGKFDGFTATDEQKEILTKVLDDAEALCDELNAYEELDGDLVQWYYNKYKAQNENV